jgi:hypothetical protein
MDKGTGGSANLLIRDRLDDRIAILDQQRKQAEKCQKVFVIQLNFRITINRTGGVRDIQIIKEI